MKHIKTRNGFSIITAIFLIVLMSTVAIFVTNLSGKIVKSTTLQYQHEQAELYAKSYTEFAVMAVMGHDRSSDCLKTINGTIGSYAIRTHIAYIGPASVIGNCAANRQLSTDVTTSSTPLTVIIDSYVDYKDLDDNNHTYTVHRRTVQKI
ncbi:hypothetical protein MNB_SV-3-579 [hydrothermal vent metagenome]|uniref:Type 4 fimbrial biogenesis protein PilX N-terminal domain-containing protein n=1 Tax=hydrothermal vent metagenome TaxID=652676 RepID=A0A1W1CVG6_9ZZZZ